MVRIVRRFLTTLFPQMPTTLDFRMYSEKDFIGYIPVMDNPKTPVPVAPGLFVRHFIIMEDADACSFFLAPSTAMTVAYSDDEQTEVIVKVVNVDREDTIEEHVMTIVEWTDSMAELIKNYQN